MNYKKQRPTPQTLTSTTAYYEGETIEEKVRKMTNNKEPISDMRPIIYTERKDGIDPSHDIRTDRWEHAVEAMDAVTKSAQAKREFRIGERTWDTMSPDQQKAHVEKFGKHSKYYKPETNQQS